MRWTFIILSFILTGLLTARADEGLAQANVDTKITIQLQDVALKTALKKLSDKAKVDFAYNTQAIPLTEKVSVKATDEPLGDVLNRMINPIGLSYRVIGKNILIEKTPKKSDDVKAEVILSNPMGTAPKAFNITGWVTDSLKNPLVGATVSNKTKKTSTITDDAGRFEILAADGDQIVVTFIGYKNQSFIAAEKENLVRLVLLPVAQGLSEVVVSTGYQKIPQERATGSFDFVDNKTINQQVGSNILDRLNGVASGVIFVNHQNLIDGPSNGIMVRGASTINGLKDPLIVVDNFPYDGNLSNINPNDIEDISILKDAAAASIWGVKAANGVVVITTKKGRLNKPLQANFNSVFINTTKPDLSTLRTMSSSDYIDLEQFLFGKGYYDGYLSNTSDYPAMSPVVDLLNQARNGTISASQATDQINALRNNDIRNQYSKYFYRQAQKQQYAFNVSGGSEKIAYYLSAGYDKNIDQLDAKADRITLRSQNQFKITKDLSVNTNIQYTRTNTLSGRPPFGSIAVGSSQMQVPYLQFADSKGNALPVPAKYSRAYTDTAGKGKFLDWNYYPLTDWQHSYSQNKMEDISANVNLDYSVFKGLKASVSYNFESQRNLITNMNDQSSYYTRDLINRFTQINSSTGAVTYIVPVGGIFTLFNDALETNNARGQLTYHADFGKHTIDAIAGSEVRQTTGNSAVSPFFGYNPDVLTTIPVDFVNAYPTNPNGSYQNIYGLQSLSQTTNRYISVFANASYTYNERYIVSGSARRDASNLFGVTTNNKWNPLWSAGLGWIVSKEPFYHWDAMPFLKLRATYGYSGNTNPAIAALLTFNTFAQSSPPFLPSASIQNYPNPGLKWEKDRTVNIALDFSSKNNRFSGSIEAYIKKGIDLYGPAPVDPTAGTSPTIVRNFANMTGKGLEADINVKLITGKFRWDAKVLYDLNTSTATKYNLDTTLRAQSFINNGRQVSPVVGQPLYAIVAYKWAGLDNNGNPQGFLNGKISEDYTNILNTTRKEDLVYKPALPTHFGSLINSVFYNGFTLDINISYRFGYYFVKPTVGYSALASNGATIGSSDYGQRWQKPGDEKITNVPSFIYPADPNRDNFYGESAANVDKADNVRLQYINLAYDLGRLIKNKNLLKNAQLYVNASNLGILWKANHDGIDPDYLTTPVQGKTFALGLRAGF